MASDDEQITGMGDFHVLDWIGPINSVHPPMELKR